MRAWYLVASPSQAVTQEAVRRFRAALGEPTAHRRMGEAIELADYSALTGSRLRGSPEGLVLDDGGDEGGGEVSNTIVVAAGTPSVVTITTDATGLFPVHHAQHGSVFAAASHLHALSAALGLPLDPVGEVEQFGLGYAVGTRTLYLGASRLRPASSLVFDGEVRVTQRTDIQPLYVDGPALVSRSDAPEAVWESLKGSCRRLGDTTEGPVGVFLSGGLDSRMLVAGLAAEHVPMVAATHGQAHLQEVKVARRVARLASTPLTVSELGPLPLLGSEDDLTDLFFRADHLLFPWWRHTSGALVAAGARTATTGYMLDATLGGHFHDEGMKDQRLKRRMRSAVQAPNRAGAAFLESDHYVADFVARQIASMRASLQFRQDVLAADSALRDPDVLEAAEADVEAELAHYRTTGTHSPARLKERFLVENRARRYAFSQELIARRWLGLAVPTADVDLLRLLASLPSHWLLDHHLYFQVMRTHAPAYAAIPGSNSPLRVSAPTAALEVTRALRNRYDRVAMRTTLRTQGRVRLARYGSVDYEDVARRPGADEGVRAIVTHGSGRNYTPDGAAEVLDDIAGYGRFSFNMVQMTILATLQLAADVADGRRSGPGPADATDDRPPGTHRDATGSPGPRTGPG